MRKMLFRRIVHKCSCFLVILLPLLAYAQSKSWMSFEAAFGDTKGLIDLHVSLRKIEPIASQPFLVMAGVKIKDCNADGLAEETAKNKLKEISNSINLLISKNTSQHSFAGTFTHECAQIHYFYVNDTTGLRQKLMSLFVTEYTAFTFGLNFKFEKQWQTYNNFLYPGEDIIKLLKGKHHKK